MKIKFLSVNWLLLITLIVVIVVVIFLFLEHRSSSDIQGLKVHYIDVGKADSILIQQGNNSMLIDAGNKVDGEKIKKYISKQGINKIDYIVGTHPHKDHLGGLAYVINNFDFEKIFMPNVTITNSYFKNIQTAIKKKGRTVTDFYPGESFKLGEASFTILGPINSEKDELNTYSMVIKVVYKDTKFLFEGDALVSNEKDMLNKGMDLSADVLKVSHHGNRDSTSQDFLNKVNPKYAVISVGKGFGLPHKETMEKLQNKRIEVYRTDQAGTVVATSDGSNISFNCKAGDYSFRGNGDSSKDLGE